MNTTTTAAAATAGRLYGTWMLDGAGQLTLTWEVDGSGRELDYSNSPRRIASATAAARSETPSFS